MRVRSLDLLPPLERPTAVIVNSDGFAVELSSFESGSVFYRSVPDQLPENYPLVIVNPTFVIIGRLDDIGAFQGTHEIELWVDSEGIADLVKCLENFENLAVHGSSTGPQWFRLGIRPSEISDRPGQDLVLGLKASLLRVGLDAATVFPSSLPATATNSSPKAELVRAAARIAKPIKPYLPASVIRILYKAVGVLR